MTANGGHVSAAFVGFGISTCITLLVMEREGLCASDMVIFEARAGEHPHKTLCFWSRPGDELDVLLGDVIERRWRRVGTDGQPGQVRWRRVGTVVCMANPIGSRLVKRPIVS